VRSIAMTRDVDLRTREMAMSPSFYVWKPTTVTETVTEVLEAFDAAEAVIREMYWLLYDPPGS